MNFNLKKKNINFVIFGGRNLIFNWLKIEKKLKITY